MTPVIYERDIIQVTSDSIILENWENNGTGKIGLVPLSSLSGYGIDYDMIFDTDFFLKIQIEAILCLLWEAWVDIGIEAFFFLLIHT